MSECPLSRRQLQVMRLLADGLVYKAVAQRLGISWTTVRSHAHNAYRALGVATAAQAVLLCTREGWLEPSPHEERDVTWDQRLYLAAFDQHLRAGDDERELKRAKIVTDAALGALRPEGGRSVPSRMYFVDGRLTNKIASLTTEEGVTDWEDFLHNDRRIT